MTDDFAARHGGRYAIDLLTGLGCEGQAAVVVDLVLGSWRLQDAAHQVANQLAADVSTARRPVESSAIARAPSLGDLIGAGIDAEAQGRSVIEDACRLGTELGALARSLGYTSIVTFGPRNDMGWSDEDVFFLDRIARDLRLTVIDSGCDWPRDDGTIIRWMPAHSTDQSCPGSLLRLVPGVIDQATSDALDDRGVGDPDVFALGTSLVVDPRVRPTPSVDMASEFDCLAERAAGLQWLLAYAEIHGSNLYVRPSELVASAWDHFHSGGSRLALRYLERAAECSVGTREQAAVVAQQQGVRIASHCFREAAEVADPPETLPSELRRFLVEAKAWGLAMTDAPDDAVTLLHSLDPDRGDPSLADLYLLNILALSELRAGNIGAAMDLEETISDLHNQLPRRDFRLQYVNSLNRARLAVRCGDFASAAAFYESAFETTDGLRTFSDAVFANVTWARLYAKAGRRRDALLAWVRAVLHLLANPGPEALSLRTASSIVGSSLASTGSSFEPVAATLYAELEVAASIIQIGGNDDGWYVEALHRIDGCWTAYGSEGLGVFVGSDRNACSWAGIRESLRSLLSTVLTALLPDVTDKEPRVVGVDVAWGSEIPRTREDLVDAACRLGVSQVIWNGQRTDLGADALSGANVEVSVGPGVANLDLGETPHVVFKRYRPRMDLNEGTASVLKDALSCLEVRSRERGDDYWTVVREMERCGVIRVHVRIGKP